MVESGNTLYRTQRIRPVRSASVEGLHADSGSWTPAGLNGVIMRVVDGSISGSNITTTNEHQNGTLIRVSTNRPYTANNTISVGQNVVQPDDATTTTDGDIIGQTTASVWGNGITADVAARTINRSGECPSIHRPGSAITAMHGVQRNTTSLSGSDVLIYYPHDSGIGVNQLSVSNTQVDVTMTYAQDSSGTTISNTLEYQIVTEVSESITDSAGGAPVLDMDGQLVGLFVGISDANECIVTPINQIENAIGAQTVTGLRFTSLQSLPTLGGGG